MRKLTATWTALAVAAFVSVISVRADQPKADPAKQESADMRFAKEAARGGRAEVVLGELAVRQAANPAVREFAQRMVKDHSLANEELTAVASRQGLTLPKELDKKHQEAIDRFSQLQGAEFDQAYMKHMRKDHEHDLAAFKKEANEGQNPALREFATKTLPTLEEHLKMAKDTEQAVQSNR